MWGLWELDQMGHHGKASGSRGTDSSLLLSKGHYLKGESWTPIDQKWVPFRLNLLPGEHDGGAYTLGDM
jgi:hypothetical protein